MISIDQLKQTARKIFDVCFELKQGERVALVYDKPSRIVAACENVLKEKNIQFQPVKIRLARPQSSPIPEAAEAFKNVDVILAPTMHSISHSPETTLARKYGARAITLPNITEELFLKILEADMKAIDSLNMLIYNEVKDATEIKIQTPSGTDITVHVDPKRPWKPSGMKCIAKGELCNLPSGETFCAPLETGANGIIVIDRWNEVTTNAKATLTVKNGKIVGWSSGAEPYVLKLKEAGESGLTIAELGIGTNPEHLEPIGNILHDEKIYGSAHIAFGMNTSFGGINKSTVHEDVILMHASIFVNGHKLVY